MAKRDKNNFPKEIKMKKAFLEAGRIINVHGIAGEVKFEHWCDGFDSLKRVKCFYLDSEGKSPVALCSKRIHGKFLLLKLEGINDPESARRMKNKILYVAREDVFKDPDSVFICDIIGLDLIDVDENKAIGKITDVVNRGASDLYLVDMGGREEYFPAVKEFIVKIDTESGVYVKVPAGLFDKAE